MKKSAILLCIVALVSLASEAMAECPKSFDQALDQQLDALNSRDLDAYMGAIPKREEQLMILPDGSTWTSRDEIEANHKEWFKDKTWVFNTQLKRRDVRDHWGVVVYRVTVDRPDAPGNPFLLSMMFAHEKDGCWYLQHDQNTLLPTP